MRALVGMLASAGLLAGGLISSSAAYAVVNTTARVVLNYTDTPNRTRMDFDQTNGGDGFTTATQSGSLPFTSGFAQALLPPGTGVPAVVMRADAHGSSGAVDVGGSGGATAEIRTDEIVFTTPANSAGQQFSVGFDFNVTGHLTATGAGLATGDVSVLFYSLSLPDEELSPTHFSFDTNTLGSGPVAVARSGFTSYTGGGPVLLPGAVQPTNWKFYLDVALSAGAVNVWCSGCGLPDTGTADSDFTNTFTGRLVYDPALTLHSPFNAALVPEPDTYVLLLAGLGVIGFAARRKPH